MKLLEHFNDLSLHPNNAEKLKNLILQSAFQGKLTANWRENNKDVQSASDLIDAVSKLKDQFILDKKIRKDKVIEPIKEKEIPYVLPINWKWCRLNEFATLINGDRGKNYPSKAHYVDSGIPFITAGNLGEIYLKHENLNYITEERFSLLRSGQVEKDDILYCLRGSLGKCAIVEGIDQGAIASSLCIIRIIDGVMPDFLLSYFMSPLGTQMILRHDNGTAQPNLSATDVKTYLFPLPPIEEQKAIVETVNELIQEVNQLKALTKERIKLKEDFVVSALNKLTSSEDTSQEWNYLATHFKTFFTEKKSVKSLRETIIQLAVQGKLTKKWREENPNVEPASELLERIEQEKQQLIAQKKIKKEKTLAPLDQDELSFITFNGWAPIRLGKYIKLVSGRDLSPSEYSDSKLTYPYLTGASQIRNNTIILSRWTNRPKVLSEVNDLLLSCKGTIGKTIINNIGDLHIARQIMALRLYGVGCIEYVKLIIENKVEALQAASKSMIPGISREDIINLMVNLPPLEEQKVIVEKVNSLMALCDELEEQIINSETQIELLMKSCLKEALEI